MDVKVPPISTFVGRRNRDERVGRAREADSKRPVAKCSDRFASLTARKDYPMADFSVPMFEPTPSAYLERQDEAVPKIEPVNDLLAGGLGPGFFTGGNLGITSMTCSRGFILVGCDQPGSGL